MAERTAHKSILRNSLAAGSLLAACGSEKPGQAAAFSSVPPTLPGISTPDARPTPTVRVEFTPTLEPTATLTVIPTAEPTKLPTATEIPRVEKSPLPYYGVFWGSFVVDGGGPAAIVIASIPETNTTDFIAVYYAQARADRRGAETAFIVSMDTVSVKDKTFLAINQPAGNYKLQEATLGGGDRTLTGIFNRQGYEQKFQANFRGTGRINLINSIKRAKIIGFALQNTDLSRIVINDVQGVEVVRNGQRKFVRFEDLP